MPSCPGTGGSLGAYALVGMGAVFAGAARAPITAVVILFELTGEYTIILPLMLAIVLATGISHLVSHDTVYTRKLLRRGIDIDEPADATLRRRPVSDVMTTPPRRRARTRVCARSRPVSPRPAAVPCRSRTPTDTTSERSPHTTSWMPSPPVRRPPSKPSPFPPHPWDRHASIGDALKQLDNGSDAIPVQDTNGDIVGWVRHRDMLTALSTAQ